MPRSTQACARAIPQWGVRDTGDVRTLADSHGFDFVERVAMPANNLSLVFSASEQ